jgi:hypothetical protein
MIGDGVHSDQVVATSIAARLLSVHMVQILYGRTFKVTLVHAGFLFGRRVLGHP